MPKQIEINNMDSDENNTDPCAIRCVKSPHPYPPTLYLCNHLSESIRSWTKGTLPHPYTTLHYPTLPYPNQAYPTLPYPIPTLLPFPTTPLPSLPYPNPYQPTLPLPSNHTLPLPHPTLPLPYPLRIQTHAHNQASRSQATLSCDRSY